MCVCVAETRDVWVGVTEIVRPLSAVASKNSRKVYKEQEGVSVLHDSEISSEK